jgi:hypothetical protein
VFAVAGILALFAMTSLIWEGMRTRFWTPTTATITKSEVHNENGHYVPELNYVYSVNGHNHTGTRYKPGTTSFDSEAEADRVHQRYREDRKVTCYVNPSEPRESYLELASPFQFLLIFLPLVFIAVGVGGIIGVRRGTRTKPISERHGKAASGAGVLRLMGGVFMLLGGGFLYGLAVDPWLDARAAANWPEVPCRITSSSVSSHRSSKGGTSHSLHIRYEYVADGQTYTGDRYDFGKGTSGTHRSKEEIARDFPEGKHTVCYVNPADPSDAVLVRQSGVGWFILVPSVFFVVGLLLFANAGRVTSTNRRAVPKAGPLTSVGGLRGTIGETTASGPVSLTPAGSRLGGFLVLLIFALFWNGVVFGVLLYADTPTPVKLFLSIFALVGIALAAGVVHQFLSLFNPRVTVQANASAVRLGESLEVRFGFVGNTRRIQRLKITLRGEEVATYRRGTDTRTDRHVFHEAVLLDTSDPALMQSGAVTLTIPHHAMHSFDAANNKIVWKLELHGDIPRWPDVKVDFPITVLPHPISIL